MAFYHLLTVGYSGVERFRMAAMDQGAGPNAGWRHSLKACYAILIHTKIIAYQVDKDL